MSAGSSTATARMRAPAWLTTWAMSYRLSIRGLTINARCPAISARRSRRMSSSLFPLNIGPQTTSSQPPARGCVRITGGSLVGAPDVDVRVVGREAEALVEAVRRLALRTGRQVDAVGARRRGEA